MAKGNSKELKCVVVGDGLVGKTCLLMMYKLNQFPEQYVPTIFDNYVMDTTYEGKTYSLGLCDTAGQEEYDILRVLGYPNTHVFILCFSVVNRDSQDNIKERWHPELTHYNPQTPVVLVGTKIDLRNNVEAVMKLEAKGEKVSTTEEGTELAQDIQAVSYVECSALTGVGIKAVFTEAVRAAVCLQKKSKKKKCKLL